MPTDSHPPWTDERVQITVTTDFIFKQFRPEIHKLLRLSISSGTSLTDTTYLGWILERAPRFFLILVHLGLPEQIFGLVDESYHDRDLPIASEAVKHLNLSQSPDSLLDQKFYQAQFRYVSRDVKQGTHIHFLSNETIPVTLIGSTTGIGRSVKDGIEKVYLSNDSDHVYGRKRVLLDEAPNHLTEADVLSDITYAKSLANEHILSVYASYVVNKTSFFVLLTPAVACTLQSFLDSPPKQFENLPKVERREIILNWPHCLANGLAWLHLNRRNHGAIRPSNVLIDSAYRICLGQVDGLSITHGNAKVSDIEAYQYAAPERWKRAATMQTKAPPTNPLHSGGRTSRKASSGNHGPATSANDPHEPWSSAAMSSPPSSPIDMSMPTSIAYPYMPSSKPHLPRAQRGSVDGTEHNTTVASSNSSLTRQERLRSVLVSPNQSLQQSGGRMAMSTSSARSVLSSNSSDSGHNNNQSRLPNSVIVAPSEIRTAVVQTWQSAQFDLYAADVFSLGAIILEIITYLCKRSSAAFSRHRSAKNRTAGRGGGVADASFHANLGQVYSWSVLLQEDAKKKKVSREEGKVLNAVGPIVDVAQECLARDPEGRPEACVVEKSLGGCVRHFTRSGGAHCVAQSLPRDRDPARAKESRSGGYPPGRKASGAVSGMSKATAPERQPAPRSENSRLGSNNGIGASAMAHFDFGSDQGPETVPTLRGEVGQQRPGEIGDPRDLAGDAPTGPRAIADRPGPIRNGTDVTDWNHNYSDSRASYIPFDTAPTSITETQLDEKGSVSKSPPPTRSPKQQSGSRSDRERLQQSLPPSQVSNTARKRTTPSAARQGLETSISESPGEQEHGRDVDVSPEASKSGSSTTDSTPPRYSDNSTSETSRNRNSVSTLASNTSTLRMSWKPRAVSPVSSQGTRLYPDSPAGESICVRSAKEGHRRGVNGDDEDDQYSVAAGLDSTGSGGQSRRASKTWDLSTAEQMWENLQSDQVSTQPASGEHKGKQRAADGAGSMRARLKARYSLLGGGKG